jgi:hypothetical protein
MRTLRLTREPLTELTDADLTAVVGGITHGCTIYPTLADLKGCLAIDRAPIHSVDNPCTT